MIVTWRRFQLARRFGPKVQLGYRCYDHGVISLCGTPIKLGLVPARRNQARLLVMFDASPSMVPWRNIGKAVADSLGRSQLGHTARCTTSTTILRTICLIPTSSRGRDRHRMWHVTIQAVQCF